MRRPLVVLLCQHVRDVDQRLEVTLPGAVKGAKEILLLDDLQKGVDLGIGPVVGGGVGCKAKEKINLYIEEYPIIIH